MNKNPRSTYKIRFPDCDMFGHLNNSKYIDYLMNARLDHLNDSYHFDIMEHYKNNLVWVVGHHEITYLKPAFFNEVVNIQSTLILAEPEYILVEVCMMDEKESHMKAIMRSRLIPINPQTGKKEKHSQELLTFFKSLENVEKQSQSTLQDSINFFYETKKNGMVG